MSNTITTKPAQRAKLLVMRYLGLPYTPDYVPTNFRCFSFCEVMKSVEEKLWRSEVGGWWLRAIYHFENFALIEIEQVPIKRGVDNGDSGADSEDGVALGRSKEM